MTSKRQYSIAILLPTRGRTDALDRSVKSVIEQADNKDRVQIMLGFDNDDTVGLEHFVNNLQPWLDANNINYTACGFERMGYTRLNEYVNELAKQTDSDWLVFWNDDAIMQTQGWDTVIASYTGEFKLLAFHTHKDHPYSIFPIVPREWLDVTGYLCPHQISDAWLSQQAYMLDIWQRIEVWVEHDRHDLTGNNNDQTFAGRQMLEGNPSDPRDFQHLHWRHIRHTDVDKLAAYMRGRGLDTTFWKNVLKGIQDPWEKLKANDVNGQCQQYVIKYVSR